MTPRAELDTTARGYEPGAAGTAGDQFRVPEPRKPADQTTKGKTR